LIVVQSDRDPLLAAHIFIELLHIGRCPEKSVFGIFEKPTSPSFCTIPMRESPSLDNGKRLIWDSLTSQEAG
jgi:hypothetical protein